MPGNFPGIFNNLFKDKKQGENLYYMCCLLEENGPPLGLLLNYSKAAEDFDLISRLYSGKGSPDNFFCNENFYI